MGLTYKVRTLQSCGRCVQSRPGPLPGRWKGRGCEHPPAGPAPPTHVPAPSGPSRREWTAVERCRGRRRCADGAHRLGSASVCGCAADRGDSTTPEGCRARWAAGPSQEEKQRAHGEAKRHLFKGFSALKTERKMGRGHSGPQRPKQHLVPRRGGAAGGRTLPGSRPQGSTAAIQRPLSALALTMNPGPRADPGSFTGGLSGHTLRLPRDPAGWA